MRRDLLRFDGAVERDPAIDAWMKKHAGVRGRSRSSGLESCAIAFKDCILHYRQILQASGPCSSHHVRILNTHVIHRLWSPLTFIHQHKRNSVDDAPYPSQTSVSSMKTGCAAAC